MASSWLTEFSQWLELRGYTRNSIKCYLSRLRKLAAWLEAGGCEPLRLAEPGVVERYLEDLEDSRQVPLGGASRRQIGDSVGCWLRYARATGLLVPEPLIDPETRPLKTRAWLEPFAQHLRLAGHRRNHVRTHLYLLARVGDFLKGHGLEPMDLAKPATLDLCLQTGEVAHGPNVRKQLHSAVQHWLAYARRIGLVPSLSVPQAPPLVEDYLRFAREHRGLSPSSLGQYRTVLLGLAEFLPRHGVASLVAIPLDLVEQYLTEAGRGRSRTSLASSGAAVRGFLRWLFLIGEEPEDRSRWLEGPQVYREMRLPRHLDDQQLQQTLGLIDRATRIGKRDWLVMVLISGYGLRIGEVAHLRLEDLDWQAHRLRVRRSKTQSETFFPTTDALEEAWAAYLEVRPATLHRELFVTWRAPIRPYASGGALGERAVSRYLRQVPGTPAQGAHVLRHTLARRLRQSGEPVTVIRRILGHQSSTSTGRYLRIATDELREVAANYSDLLGC
ncbi:MAG: tyrosine-type recombinase/integrase [Lacunisphaera sp.]|nr:tyrosine-type recombinase/integrase [Lacunisphaera sp.]